MDELDRSKQIKTRLQTHTQECRREDTTIRQQFINVKIFIHDLGFEKMRTAKE